MNITRDPTPILPIVSDFKSYLRDHGCEIMASHSEYELVRFRSALGVGVLYCGKKGISCDKPFVADALALFQARQPWQAGKTHAASRRPTQRRKTALLERDGPDCFYCGRLLEDDITEEHLIPVSHGGSNRLDNCVLAHFRCNQLADSKPLVEKILLRDQMRKETFFRNQLRINNENS